MRGISGYQLHSCGSSVDTRETSGALAGSKHMSRAREGVPGTVAKDCVATNLPVLLDLRLRVRMFGFGGGLVPETPEGDSLGPPCQDRLSTDKPFSKFCTSVAVLPAFGFVTTWLYRHSSSSQKPKSEKSMHVMCVPRQRPLKLHPSAPVASSLAKEIFGSFALRFLTMSLTPSWNLCIFLWFLTHCGAGAPTSSSSHLRCHEGTGW